MYKYEEQRADIFTDDGIKTLCQIRDSINNHDVDSGACTVGAATRDVSGNSWLQLACIDYLVETGFIEYIDQKYATQNWVIRKRF